MAIVRYNPWTLLKDIQGEMNELFDKGLVQGTDSSEIATAQWSPHVDIREETDKFIIIADLPGIEPKDIHVAMENNILTIRGERKLERKVKEENYSRMERFSGTFYRRFTLPDQADGENIRAKGKNGVLEITIPKKERNIPKKIEVRVEA